MNFTSLTLWKTFLIGKDSPDKKLYLYVGNTKCSYLKGFVYPPPFLRMPFRALVSGDNISDLLKDDLAPFHYTLIFIMSLDLLGLNFFPFILFDPRKYCCPIVLDNFTSPSRADITSLTTTRPQVSISHVSSSSSRSKAGIKDSKGSNILDIVHWMEKNSRDFRNQPKQLFIDPLIYGNYFISSNYNTEMSNRYFCF